MPADSSYIKSMDLQKDNREAALASSSCLYVKPLSLQDRYAADIIYCDTKIEVPNAIDISIKSPIFQSFIKASKQNTNDLPHELEHINKAIEDSKYILNLKSGWDQAGAQMPSKNAFNYAVSFLKKYSTRLFDIFNVNIEAPSIHPLNDGSIDLEWISDRATFLINFKNNQDNIAFYYAKVITETNQINDSNGQATIEVVSDEVAVWLINFPQMEN
jgi:hypothetical protein